MNSNGTRFHLLLGQDDWSTCTTDGSSLAESGLAWWDAGWQAVRLPSRYFQFTMPAGDVAPEITLRRGAGVDGYGNWYWIDGQSTGIRVLSSGSGTVSTFWTTGAGLAPDQGATVAGAFRSCEPPEVMPRTLGGLAVTTTHYLVVGLLDPGGLLVFDLHAGGPPRPEPWFASFAPFDMSPAPDGGVWMLERASSTAPARLWRLDHRLEVRRLTPDPGPVVPPPPHFRPVDVVPEAPLPACSPSPPATPEPGASLSLQGLGDVIAIEALPDGSVLLLANEAPAVSARLWRYSINGGLRGPFRPMAQRGLIDAEGDPGERVPLRLQAHDLAFVPVAEDANLPPHTLPGRLFLVERAGNQAFGFALTETAAGLELDLLPEYRPMRLFSGRALIAFGPTAYYDSGERWVPLVEQPRPRYATELTVSTPLLLGGDGDKTRHAFDGREPDCVWHRLLLDCCLPPTTSITVRSRAANSVQELATAAWRPEPTPYRRREGSELPYVRSPGGRDWGTVETLFQAAHGRFLQLEITLHGDGRSSPRLRNLRAYYPRFSYLDHYLPAVYREDPLSASFLDRFLANLEGITTGIEDRIGAVRALMDVRSVPAEYLDWLAGWFGVMLNPYWDEARRRLFIAYAPELFRQRGTVPGVIRAIRLATDPVPDASIFTAAPDELLGAGRPSTVRIVEHFRTRAAPGLIFGDPAGAEGPGLTTEVSTWTPALGPAPLHEAFQTYLRPRYEAIRPGDALVALNGAWGTSYSDFSVIELFPTRPANPAAREDWERFLRAELGFTYAPVTGSDRERYRDFLARRYGSIEAFNRAHGRAGTTAVSSFAAIALPQKLPSGGVPLRDWMQFVSLVLPTSRNAHRFTVLVPTVAGEDVAGRADLSEQVRRVVELEKPAHTAFDIREYWAAFRVGEARLGFDTLVDRGNRLTPILLGRSGLAGGYLGYAHPWSAPGRMVLGPSSPRWPESEAVRPSFASCPSPAGGSA